MISELTESALMDAIEKTTKLLGEVQPTQYDIYKTLLSLQLAAEMLKGEM